MKEFSDRNDSALSADSACHEQASQSLSASSINENGRPDGVPREPASRKFMIKGTLKGWTGKSAVWYERASEYTGYHDRLLESLLRFLKPEDRCCEIACGTGILARKTAPHVASYAANDADPVAVSFLRERLEDPEAPALEVLKGEWQEALAGRTFDVVLTSYYGVPVEYWPLLRSVITRSFIVICPRDEHWRKVRSRDSGDGSPGEETIRKLETPGNIKAFLTQQKTPFEALPLDLEFGQPFLDIEEAKEYVRHYYRLEGTDAEQFVQGKIRRRDDGVLYFPKKKEIEIIAADLSGPRLI